MKKKKQREVKRLRGQFWPDYPITTTIPNHRTVKLKCDIAVGFTIDAVGGKPRWVDVALIAPEPAIAPTFGQEFLWGRDGARAALEYVREGSDSVDLYFEAMRNGDTDKEYVKGIKRMGIPLTTGPYFLEWDPAKAYIEPEIYALAKGEEDPQRIKSRLVSANRRAAKAEKGPYFGYSKRTLKDIFEA